MVEGVHIMMDKCLLHTSDVHSPQKQRGNTWQLEKFRSFPADPAVGGRSTPCPMFRISNSASPLSSCSKHHQQAVRFCKPETWGAQKVAMSAPRIVLQKSLSIRCGCPTNTSRPITIIKSLHLLHPTTPLYNPLNISF